MFNLANRKHNRQQALLPAALAMGLRALIIAALFAAAQSASAAAIGFAPFSVYHATEYINSPADDATIVESSVSRQLEIGASVVDLGTGETLGDEVMVTGVNSADPGNTYTFRTFGGPVYDPGHFIELDYDAVLAGGSWEITATRLSDGETATATVGAHNPATVINPFDVSALEVAGSDLNPTLSWDLPGLTGSGSDYDLLAVQVVDPTVTWSEEGSIFFEESLSTSATSYTFASGVLEAGKDYILRVRSAYWDAENGFANFLTGSTYSTVGIEYSTHGVDAPAPAWLLLLGLLAGLRCRHGELVVRVPTRG